MLICRYYFEYLSMSLFKIFSTALSIHFSTMQLEHVTIECSFRGSRINTFLPQMWHSITDPFTAFVVTIFIVFSFVKVNIFVIIISLSNQRICKKKLALSYRQS